MERTVYWISPHDDGWKVQRQGGERASNVYPTKEQAIERGRELAKANEPSQLVMQRADGTIEKEWTYGHDPVAAAG